MTPFLSPARRPGPRDAARPRGPFAARMRMALALAGGLLLAACGGGGTAPSEAQDNAGRLRAAAAGELVEHARGLLRRRADLRAQSSPVALDRSSDTLPVTASPTAGGPSLAASPGYSRTRTQEPGVDEPDLLKTDGRLLYALDAYSARTPGGRMTPLLRTAVPGADGSVTPRQSIALSQDDGYPVVRGLLLGANAPRLLALTEHITPVALPQPCPPGMACIGTDLIWAPTALRAHVQLQAAERAADGTLALGRRLDVEGRFVQARQVGDTVYLLATHTPTLAAEQLPATATAAEREAAIRALGAADLLPRLRVDGGSWQPLLAETDCLLQPDGSSTALTLTTLVAIDLASPDLRRSARCVLGGTEALYLTTQHLVVATTRSPQVVILPDGRLQYPANFVTDLHRFAINGLSITYRSSGEVDGHLGWDAQRMALRISEHAGDLRVLSFTGTQGWIGDPTQVMPPSGIASPARLTVLREDPASARLRPIATLPNAQRPAPIGKPGEQIHGVRFDGDRAYLSTFLLRDPLYVLDLRNPADPRIAGELDVPGVADTLVPLGNGLLLGVGRDADAAGQLLGVQLSLFDVGDPAQPRQLQTLNFGARGSQTTLDTSTQGLSLLASGNGLRLAMPISARLGDFGPTAEHGLFRFELDPATRRLVQRPTLAAPAGTESWDIALDRGAQVADAVFYLTQGHLIGRSW